MSGGQWIVVWTIAIFACIQLVMISWRLMGVRDALAGIREELAHLRRMVP